MSPEVLAVAVDAEHVAELAPVDRAPSACWTPGWYRSKWPGMRTRSRSSASATSSSISCALHRRRLLDEYVLAGLERALRELVVRGHGRRDDDRVERLVGEHLVEATRSTAPADSAPRTRRPCPRPDRRARRARRGRRSSARGSSPSRPGRPGPTRTVTASRPCPSASRSRPWRCGGRRRAPPRRRAGRSRSRSGSSRRRRSRTRPARAATELMEMPFSVNEGTCGSW